MGFACLLSLTRVYPNANCKRLSRHMADSKDLNGTQEMQSHCGYFQSVFVAVADR